VTNDVAKCHFQSRSVILGVEEGYSARDMLFTVLSLNPDAEIEREITLGNSLGDN